VQIRRLFHGKNLAGRKGIDLQRASFSSPEKSIIFSKNYCVIPQKRYNN